MKKILFGAIAFSVLVFAACNSGKNENEGEGHDMDHDSSEHQHANTNDESEIKAVQVAFTNVDAMAAASIKEIIDHYLHIKNALANDNAAEAAKGGEAMAAAVTKLDKSLLTAEQKKVFDENQSSMKEHAEQVSRNENNIKIQREHFATTSEAVYTLAKTFGGGRPLYHDHCPMYNNNKGGMWLSETKEIKNPFFGAEMPACGKVQEIIQ